MRFDPYPDRRRRIAHNRPHASSRCRERSPHRDREPTTDRREPLADGGTRSREFDVPEPGDTVRDREQGDLLVVADTHPDTPADAWEIEALDGRPTVADVNPKYSPAAPVVVAVYDDDDAPPENLRKWAYAGELRTYTFPADRLETVTHSGGERP